MNSLSSYIRKAPFSAPVGAAILSILSHSICCGIPLILVAMGMGGLSVAPMLSQYHSLFTFIGVLSLVAGVFFYWKTYHSKSCSCRSCSKLGQRCSLCMLLFAFMLQTSMWVYLSGVAHAQTPVELQNEILAKNTSVFHFESLHCPGCATAIQSQVIEMDNVMEASIRFTDKRLHVQFSNSVTDLENFRETLQALGYGHVELINILQDNKEETP